MIGNKFTRLASCLALTVVLTGAGAAQTAAPKPAAPKSTATKKAAPAKQAAPAPPALEPKAIEILKASSARLAAARSMSFTAEVTYESASRQGPPIAYTTISQVTVQRPDKLKVVTPADGPASEFYYNGKQMMAFVPADNLLAVADAPPTIDATLEAAYNSAAIYFPFTDVIVADPYKDLAPGLELAYYVGQSKVVGGVATDIVCYVAHGTFVQAWIGVDDKLPRMLRAIYMDDPEHLRHRLALSDWKLDGEVAPDAFAPANTATAKRIPFAHPNPPKPPAAKAKPSKSN